MIAVFTKYATNAILNSALSTIDPRQRCCCVVNRACRQSRSPLCSTRKRQLQAAAVRRRIPLPRDLSDEFDDDRDLQQEPEEEPDYDYEPEPEESEEEELGLVPNKEGYQTIKLEGCEFLLATASDGSLDLSDAYVQDDESGIYAQPEVTGGDIPATAQQYMPVEWRVEFLGDVVFDKPPQLLTKKVFLVHITQLEPRRLDLFNVWVLDAESRSIYKAQVDRITQTEDPAEMMLRIQRDGSLVVDAAQVMPTPDELILEIEFGEKHGEEYLPEQRWRMDDPDDDLNDPIDAIEDDFDEPDVPPVDLA